ncbi:MAG: 3-phosphoshikimate 1-carboxyvinyltransferase [Dehalococcoidia bacterium]
MDRKIAGCATLDGEVSLPGDKSISHRALIFGAIAQGRARIGNLSPGADCRSTMACLGQLGVEMEELCSSPLAVEVRGVGGSGLREAEDVLDAGNSGTTMRLLAGLLAAQPFLSILTGDRSLRSRPMGRIMEPLRLMGAQVWGRGAGTMAPLAIRGGELQGITYRLPVASAQLKSALLLAGLFARGETTLEEPGPSRDHSERMLRAMGARLEGENGRITISPLSRPLKAGDVTVPGDISSAAYWLVAGAIHPHARVRLEGVGINPTRSGILDALRAMGARLEIEKEGWEGGEPVADLLIESSELRGIDLEGDMIPRTIDELPLLAVAASAARGTTTIRQAGELRVKESDRIATTVGELSRLGVDIEELPDGMVIRGGGGLRGGEVDSHHDHRLAMALAVAGLAGRGEVVLHNAEAVDISYPAFWRDLDTLTGK